jgi:hypothetical protein
MRRGLLFMALFVALSMSLVGTLRGSAHDATPTGEASKLASLGLPELHITVTNDGYELPAEVPAGLTYVTLDNQSEGFVEAQFVMLPEDLTIEGLAAGFLEETTPESFYRAVWAGGPSAVPGTTSSAIVDLTPGDWVVAQSDSEFPLTPVALKATGEAEPAEAGAIPSDVQVMASAYKFDFPEELKAGPQVWEVTNADPVPHHVFLLYYPGEITVDDVNAIFAMEMGTPVPDLAIDPEQLMPAGAITVHSQGKISWTELDLQPGSYVALCFISDQGSDVPHAYMGMIDVFTVE